MHNPLPAPLPRLAGICLFLATLCGCSSSSDIDTPVVPTPAASLTFGEDVPPIGAAGSTAVFHFSTNEPWNIEALAAEESGDDWFRISPTQGTAGDRIAVTLRIDENETYIDRSFTLTVRTASLEKSTTVTQLKRNAVIAGENRYELSSEEQILTVEIQANVAYDVEVTAGSEWLSATKHTRAEPGLTALEHRFAVAANREPQARTATVVFKDPTSELSDEITVVQAAWEDPNPERTALEAIYRDAAGSGWTHSDNWCSDRPLDEWYGVATDAQGHVTELRLPHNNLRGAIAHEIADLTHLRILDMSHNELESDLVRELPYDGIIRPDYWDYYRCDLDDMKQLETVDLSHNRLYSSSGLLPAFKNMDALQRVDLSYNRLECQIGSSTWKPLFENGRTVDMILNGNRMYGEVQDFIQNHPEWDRLALQFVRQYYPYDTAVKYAKKIHVPDFSFTDLRTGTRQSIREVCGANELTMLLAWDPTNENSCRFAERSVRRYHTLYGAQGFAVVAIIPEGEEFRLAAERYLATHEVDWPVVAEYADAQGRRIVWPMEPYPSYLIFDREGVLKDNIHSEAYIGHNRIDDEPYTFDFVEREFQYANYMNRRCYNVFGDCTYESRDYSMNKRTEQLQQATRGKGIDIVLIGDAFTDVDIQTGFYRDAMLFAMETFFLVEPTKTYREYFNVHMVYAVSKKRQLSRLYNAESALWTGYSSITLTGGDGSPHKVDEYIADVRASSVKIPGIIVNGDEQDIARFTKFQSATNTYAYMGFAYDRRFHFRRLVYHELIGHGLGLLGDEYVTEEEQISEQEKRDIVSFQPYGSFLNLSLTDDPKAVPWAHLIGHPRYPEVGVFAGGYRYRKGVWNSASDQNIMNGSYVSTFNPVCRELIVRRILTLAGEEYTFEKFLEKDVVSTPAMSDTRARPIDPEYRHCPPIYMDPK